MNHTHGKLRQLPAKSAAYTQTGEDSEGLLALFVPRTRMAAREIDGPLLRMVFYCIQSKTHRIIKETNQMCLKCVIIYLLHYEHT